MHIKCPLCGWSTKIRVDIAVALLSDHFQTVHKMATFIGAIGKTRYCQGCDLRLEGQRAFKRHYLAHFKDASHWIEAATKAAFGPKIESRLTPAELDAYGRIGAIVSRIQVR